MNLKILWFLFVVATAYYIWSLFVASRYQSLCQLSYWSSTEAQLRACDEAQTELRDK